MRVAMGLALNEIDREARAIEFYNVLSSFDFMCVHADAVQLRHAASATVVVLPDDGCRRPGRHLQAIKDNALLSKFAGGLGNDWTRVRALGAHIKGTNGKSQGVVPFLKVVNDTAIAVNQGGKRKGAVCALPGNVAHGHRRISRPAQEHGRRPSPHARHEHGELDSRPVHEARSKNGDVDPVLAGRSARICTICTARVRRSDMRCVRSEGRSAARSSCSRTVRRADCGARCWRMLFETGHPWITFKDPCNLRSPQQHVGVVHSSNLCTEITLNTSDSAKSPSAISAR